MPERQYRQRDKEFETEFSTDEQGMGELRAYLETWMAWALPFTIEDNQAKIIVTNEETTLTIRIVGPPKKP